jgi:hypothetical protein
MLEIINDEYADNKRIQYQFKHKGNRYGIMTEAFDHRNPFSTLAALKHLTEMLEKKLVELTS